MLNRILPINKACIVKDGVFKPYSRVHIAKGRAMATNGRVVVVWNLEKLRQVDEDQNEETVFTKEVIQYLEGKSVTSQYWEALVKAKEVFVIMDNKKEKLEVMQDGRTFTLEYDFPNEKETYTEQISGLVKAQQDNWDTSKSCVIWSDFETVKKSLGVSNTTKFNMFFNNEKGCLKIVPENGYDCFAICKTENNDTNMFLLNEFNDFIEDFLTIGDSFTVKLGSIKKEEKAPVFEEDKDQINILDVIDETPGL